MRRSISLNQVDVVHIPGSVTARADTTEHLVDTCQQYLDEVKDGGENRPAAASAPPRRSESLQPSEMASADDIVVDGVDFVSARNSSPYGTLPKVMKKNISRQIVPAMKRMFEKKARSVEPTEVRLRIQTAATPTKVRRSLSPAVIGGGGGAASPSMVSTEQKDETATEESGKSDGTESVSSFVALNVDDKDREAKVREGSDGTAEASVTAADDDEDASSWSVCSSERRNSTGGGSTAGGAKKGFVNKCVSKVKNIINKGDE